VGTPVGAQPTSPASAASDVEHVCDSSDTLDENLRRLYTERILKGSIQAESRRLSPAYAADAKKIAMEAKIRCEAVSCLARLDCGKFPDVETALITALRADRIECVRLEAAIAFANGICKSVKMLEALEACVSGSDKDGYPSERSGSVRDIAFLGLTKFLENRCDRPAATANTDATSSPKFDGKLLERANKTAARFRIGLNPQLGQQSIANVENAPNRIIRLSAQPAPLHSPPTPQVACELASDGSPAVQPNITIPIPETDKTSAAGPQLIQVPLPPARIQQPAPAVYQPLTRPPAPGPVESEGVKPAERVLEINRTEDESVKANPSDEAINKLVATLLTGASPKDRNEALCGLAPHDWKQNPQIVVALVKAARLDSDRSVRVNAIRLIGTMKIDIPFIFEHLKRMANDADEGIQDELMKAMDKLQSPN
jgi:hypothetical protein